MSMELFVFSDRRLSSMSEWQRSIDSEHLGILLPTDGSIDELRGYLPVHRHEKSTGFECHHYDAAEMLASFHDIDFGRTWTQCLCFIWGSDFDEGLAASMASAAYAKAADGIVYDPQDDLVMSPREALDVARRMEEELPKWKRLAAEVASKLSGS
jgi:hypothetical protein